MLRSAGARFTLCWPRSSCYALRCGACSGRYRGKGQGKPIRRAADGTNLLQTIGIITRACDYFFLLSILPVVRFSHITALDSSTAALCRIVFRAASVAHHILVRCASLECGPSTAWAAACEGFRTAAVYCATGRRRADRAAPVDRRLIHAADPGAAPDPPVVHTVTALRAADTTHPGGGSARLRAALAPVRQRARSGLRVGPSGAPALVTDLQPGAVPARRAPRPGELRRPLTSVGRCSRDRAGRLPRLGRALGRPGTRAAEPVQHGVT